jgi:hypothetical protein
MRFLCGIHTGKTQWEIRQRAQRERTRYCRLGREGDNVAGERKQRGFLIRDNYFGFDRWS